MDLILEARTIKSVALGGEKKLSIGIADVDIKDLFKENTGLINEFPLHELANHFDAEFILKYYSVDEIISAVKSVHNTNLIEEQNDNSIEEIKD